MMLERPHYRKPAGKRLPAILCCAAVVLATGGCAGGGSEGGQAAPEGPATITGYDFRAGAPDATLAAIIAAYEQEASVRPPEEFTEDFETGAGPFQTYDDEYGSVSAVEGTLRITGNDPSVSVDSYAELREPSDRIVVSALVALAAPLGNEEGPLISIDREGDGAYGLALQGDSVFLLEWEDFADEPTLLDSATLTAPATGQQDMTLVLDGRGSAPGVAGFVNGQPLVGREGPTGSYDSVSLGVMASDTPLTVDFEAVAVYALQEGADQDVFSGQADYIVEQDGADIATITTLEPAECLRELPDFSDDTCVPGLLAGAAPEGMTVQSETIARAPVTSGTQADVSFWLWMYDGSLHVVTAQDAAAGRAFVEAFITQTEQPIGS